MFLRLIFFISLFFVFSLTVFAQAAKENTVLTGHVSDESGAAIEKIKVAATNKEGKRIETFTNEDGIYLLEISGGVYLIEFESGKGFLGVKVEGYKVAGTKMTLDIVLEVDMECPTCIFSEFICKPNKDKNDVLDCVYVSRRGNGTSKPKNLKIQPLKQKAKE